jgi:hypothetical protein
MSLTDIESKLLSNPAFEEAFEGASSALLSHLKANDTSKDCIKDGLETCMINIEGYRTHVHTSSHHIDAVRRMRTKQVGERLSASAPSVAIVAAQPQLLMTTSLCTYGCIED